MSQERVAEKSTPYWWEAAPVRELPRVAVAPRLDVLIVGAGYAGVSAGMVLARAGRSVAAFDAMSPGEGASTRNGGITSGNIRLDHQTIVRRFGEDRANAIEAEGKEAREFLRELVTTEQLDCDYQPVGRFQGAIGYDQYDTMARSAESLAKKLKIESFAVPYAEQQRYIGTDPAASFHSALQRQALFHAAADPGLPDAG